MQREIETGKYKYRDRGEQSVREEQTGRQTDRQHS